MHGSLRKASSTREVRLHAKEVERCRRQHRRHPKCRQAGPVAPALVPRAQPCSSKLPLSGCREENLQVFHHRA